MGNSKYFIDLSVNHIFIHKINIIEYKENSAFCDVIKMNYVTNEVTICQQMINVNDIDKLYDSVDQLLSDLEQLVYNATKSLTTLKRDLHVN